MIVEERELVVSCSIGIAVYPDDGRDAETLIRNADAAMYHAKELGRANYQFFTEQMNQAASRRCGSNGCAARSARASSASITSRSSSCAPGASAYEALARWQHPERGLVLPGGVHPARRGERRHPEDRRVGAREACRWSTFIGAGSHDGGGLQIAVNLSARQFNDPQLPRMVARALKETGLPPQLLELEITESTAMQQTDVTLGTLKRLKALGVSIAIDDFGTGYSSLSYLRRFPVDKVKIDRSFVAELPSDRDQGAIVSAIVALAHALQIRVVAEGVETERSATSSRPAAATSSRATSSAIRPTPTARPRITSRPRLHFAHANGFPGSSYAALFAGLTPSPFPGSMPSAWIRAIRPPRAGRISWSSGSTQSTSRSTASAIRSAAT